jgi:hypothetical protein
VIRSIVLSIGFFCFFISSAATAQTSLYEELQAAYLFNFAKYVKWPEEHETFVIGIYGESDNMELLQDILETKKVRGKAIVLKVLTDVEEIDETVSMIYVRESATKDFNVIMKAVAGESILIVTEEDMSKKGAMISFILEDSKLRFKLRKAALEAVDLVPSEGLLKLAIIL